MFCIHCGEKLSDEAKFCNRCGKKVSEESTKEVSVVEPKEMKEFTILQQTIKFPLVIKGYANVRNYFDSKAKDAVKRYNSRFKTKYYNIKDFIKYANEDFKDDLFAICHEAVILLNNNDIYDITDNTFYKKVNSSIVSWRMRYEYIQKQTEYIQEWGDIQKQYREIRKDGRGRLIGGGIGIEGAAKGIAVAGGINMATGAAHSFINGLGNYKTDLDMIGKEKKLFQDEWFFERLEEAYYFDILKVHEVFIDYLFEYKNKEKISYYGDEKYKESCDILMNIVNGNIEEMNIKKALIQALTVDPFNEEIYYYMIRNEDDLGELDALARFLNINIENIKKSVEIEKIEQRNKEEWLIREEKAKKAKEDWVQRQVDEIMKMREEEEEEEKRKENEWKEKIAQRRETIVVENLNLEQDSTVKDNIEKEELIQEVTEYLKQLRSKGWWYYRLHLIDDSIYSNTLIGKIQKAYKFDLENDEKAILVYDNTIFSNDCTNGFVLSNKCVYIKNSKIHKLNKIKLQDIKSVEVKKEILYVNGNGMTMLMQKDDDPQAVADILQYCINRLRKLYY